MGGRFTIVMRAPDGEIVHTGEYREITPPSRLVFTWRSRPTHDVDTLVTVELAPFGDGETALVLTHAELPDEPSRLAHQRGWTSIVAKLATHLSRR